MTAERPSVALIGAGAMGGALLRGWLCAGLINAERSAVFDPVVSDEIQNLCNDHQTAINPEIAGAQFDAVVIAVKPQAAPAVLPEFRKLRAGSLFISVMAGKSVASIGALLGEAARIIRVMPNLPASIGCGVSGLYAPESAGADDRGIAELLMRAAGETVWVDSESQIDLVTAVSGSGPAYFFAVTEALAEAGEAAGLPRETARALALATLTGSGALMAAESRDVSEMRKAVTSPGGTTEAALNILNGPDRKLTELMRNAVGAAAARAAQLSD